jgi:hypothetical protein
MKLTFEIIHCYKKHTSSEQSFQYNWQLARDEGDVATDGWRRKSRQIQRLAEERKTVLSSQTSARIQQNVLKYISSESLRKELLECRVEKALDARTTDATQDAIANSHETKLHRRLSHLGSWAFRCHLHDREAKSIGQQLSAHGRKIKNDRRFTIRNTRRGEMDVRIEPKGRPSSKGKCEQTLVEETGGSSRIHSRWVANDDPRNDARST